MSDRPQTPLLDQITRPADLKSLSDAQLTQVAQELRSGNNFRRLCDWWTSGRRSGGRRADHRAARGV